MTYLSATPRSIGYTLAATAVGAVMGLAIGRSAAWIAVGAVFGLATAAMVLFVGVRPFVAVPVAVGAGIGAFLGGTVVGVLCEPQGCPAFEAGAAITTGIGALVGIGLVVALTTRSFDEYYEAMQHGKRPPITGCATDPNNGDEEVG